MCFCCPSFFLPFSLDRFDYMSEIDQYSKLFLVVLFFIVNASSLSD